MKNLSKHAWIIWGLLLAVTVALMALIPFVRTAAWWVAAVCTALMFCLCAFTFARAFSRGGSLESKVLGWPIFRVGYTALIVQLIVGAVIMGVASFCPVWAAAVAEIVVFAAAGVCLTVKDAAREAVAQSEASVRDITAPWKAIRARAEAVAVETKHPELRRLAEEIRFADPTPTALDAQVAGMLETLSSYADAENIKKAFRLMEQRRALSKADK